MNLESVKEESREIFVEFTNGMCEAMALGKKTLTSIVNDSMRLQWLSGMISKVAGVTAVNVVKYGYLYNWYAATDGRNISSSNDWIIPPLADLEVLDTYLGWENYGRLKDVSLLYWTSPNTGATNEFGFNGRGSGSRSPISSVWAFRNLQAECVFHSSTYLTESTPTLYAFSLDADGTGSIVFTTNGGRSDGKAVRLLNPNTSLAHGQIGTYTGNDGRIYPTICIGTQEWISCNLAETKFRNGELITKVTDSGIWEPLTTEAYCAYDNNEGNVLTIVDGVVGGDVVDSVDNNTPTLAIERLRHYRGKYQSVDLSQIGVVTNPSAPVESVADLLRSGSQTATIGANAIVFSSPLGTNAYTVNVWIIGDGESQYDLGEITKATSGFTVSDALIEGTLYYQVIVVI